jgi:phosphonate transport system substrate-binding protein
MRPLRMSALVVVLTLLAACGGGGADQVVSADGADAGQTDGATDARGVLRIGAIPDQDPEVLARQFDLVADVLGEALDVDVEYVPVTEYNASVNLFRTGDIDLTWFGAVTGIQARLQTPTARLIAQRDIDAEFTSTFIASADAGIEPFDDVEGLSAIAGTRFTFGSESSTSSRLMPQAFLAEAGVGMDDLDGQAGFAGSHDAVIDLVEAGSFETGALGTAIWDDRVEAGDIDDDRVIAVFETPTYPNYHWLFNTDAEDRLGEGFGDRVEAALLALDPDDEREAEVLDLFFAGSFIPADPSAFDEMEAVARELGLVVE